MWQYSVILDVKKCGEINQGFLDYGHKFLVWSPNVARCHPIPRVRLTILPITVPQKYFLCTTYIALWTTE